MFRARFARVVHEAFEDQPIPELDVELIESGILDSFALLRLFMAMEDEFQAFWPVERMVHFRELSSLGRLRAAVQYELWTG